MCFCLSTVLQSPISSYTNILILTKRIVRINRIFSSLFSVFRRPSRHLKMSQDDHIVFSHQKLLMATMNVEDVGAVIANYLRETKFPPVKDFEKDLDWFNVSEPLSFQTHLKGKVVVLDFFTYCCINCMHILPDLKEIEEEFPVEDGLVVIGVHSAKFQNEKKSANILAAVQRYNIAHPVVSDISMDMWTKCDVHCWPTLLLLGPFANPIVMITGEGHKDDLKMYIKHTLNYYKSQDLISDHKLPLKSAYHLLPDMKGPLLFPGKITTFLRKDGEEILAVSDSGNNRILIINSDGEILKQIGSSQAGFKDASLDKSEFKNPQGLVFETEDLIYVADTDNHAIRSINLSKGTVETIAGNGIQGNDFKGGKLGKEQSISSPWDLVLYKTKDEKNVLIIAMAGSHQIWALFLVDTTWWDVKYKAGACIAIAGSGREENRNHSDRHIAAFAQPSGLALCKHEREVYIADSESSSIRRISLDEGHVCFVVGGELDPRNLFAFGDNDGGIYYAKLQHCLGLGFLPDDSTLFVADTYNHKIKKVDIVKNEISTLFLPPADTVDDRLKTFREPAGLCASLKEPKLYIADTNNHCIKVIMLNDKNEFSRIFPLVLKPPKANAKSFKNRGEIVEVNPVPIRKEGGKIILRVSINFMKGLKLTEEAPQKWEVYLPNMLWSCVPTSGKNLKDLDIVVSAPSNLNFTEKIGVIFDLSTCTHSTCLPKNFVIEIPLREVHNKPIIVENLIKVNLSPDTVKAL